MAIFERPGDLIYGNVNDLIGKVEDPEKMAKQVIIDMEGRLCNAASGYATAMAGVNQVKKQMEQARVQAKQREEKAKLDKMEAKIADREARDEAFAEVSDIDTYGESDPFATMEQDMAVSDDLERLKKEMGLL